MKAVSVNRFGAWACAALAAGMPAAAIAGPEYLQDVTSEVYQATGTAKEIAARGEICMSQTLAPGVVSAPLIISKDLDRGVVVARSAAEYGGGGMMGVRWKIRSTFTFEARDGRFRIQQTNLERFYGAPTNIGWGAIPKAGGSQWKGAEAAFAASAVSVARCLISGPKQENW